MLYPNICFIYASYIIKYPNTWSIDMVPELFRADVQSILDDLTKKPEPAE